MKYIIAFIIDENLLPMIVGLDLAGESNTDTVFEHYATA